MLRRAAAHQGTAFVEIYQNCNVYNDGAFDTVREQKENRIVLEQGKPIRFGAEDERGRAAAAGRVGGDRRRRGRRRGCAARARRARADAVARRAIARLSHTPHGPTPIGVFRDVERPVYDRLMDEQLEPRPRRQGEGDLAGLLHAGDTWTIG